MPVGSSDEQLLFLPLAHIVAKLTVMLQLRVGFVTSARTPDYERAFVTAHPRAKLIEDLGEIPAFAFG